jgi:ABC-2 type transport system permease protein
MLRSVLVKSLYDTRRSFTWWSVGLVGLVALMIAVYPTVRDNPELNQLVEEYPEALKAFIAFGGAVDYASGAGYLGSELFSFMIPLLFIVCTVGNGASAVAGEEERGTLDLLLANPVTRRRVAIEKIVAMAAELAGLAVVLWASLWLGATLVGMEISAAHLAAATASAALLALAFGAIAFMIGAATGHRALAIGLATAGAVAAYLVNGLAALVDALQGPQKLSPFYHYAIGDPLRQGLAPGHSLVLVAIALGAAVVGMLAFERRDLSSP